MALTLGTGRNAYLEIKDTPRDDDEMFSRQEERHFESLDLLYRSVP